MRGSAPNGTSSGVNVNATNKVDHEEGSRQGCAGRWRPTSSARRPPPSRSPRASRTISCQPFGTGPTSDLTSPSARTDFPTTPAGRLPLTAPAQGRGRLPGPPRIRPSLQNVGPGGLAHRCRGGPKLLSSVIQASRTPQKPLEGVAAQAPRSRNRWSESSQGAIRPLEPQRGGKQVETHRRSKNAGQAPFSAGSRIATHSTWCVIGNRSNARSVRTR